MDRDDWPLKGVGYLPVGERKLPRRTHGNLNEAFLIKRDHAIGFDDNQWLGETELPDFRSTVETYAMAMQALAILHQLSQYRPWHGTGTKNSVVNRLTAQCASANVPNLAGHTLSQTSGERKRPVPNQINDSLVTWADDLDEATTVQAMNTAALPIMGGPVALMADAHLGYGCAVGSVVPTDGAIIPSAVGVDIGCGMAAVKTDLAADDLGDNLNGLLHNIAKRVPAGVGQGTARRSRRVDAWMAANTPGTDLSLKQAKRAVTQLGSLGSGNHFVEVSVDDDNNVWVVLHSGSRGIGNELARGHIKTARAIERHIEGLTYDADLAWFTQGTTEFDHYVADLRWAQAYAWENREIMLDEVVDAVFGFVGRGQQRERISCHHNYAELETHQGRELWITRKGAIRAGTGELGVIPGSMGTDTFIVEGLGSDASYHSSSHGAGRRMSRNKARKTLSVESLEAAMGNRTWLASKANRLVDEHPKAYKDIAHVMELQADLVKVRDRLSAVLNYKGT